MFIGAINNKLRQFFWEHAAMLEGRDVYLGCSGNFTVEQIITRRCSAARLFSNDIALYSSIIGHTLMGQEFDLKIEDSEYLWLKPYLKTPREQIAALLIIMEMLKYEKQNNAFSERMWAHYLITWPEYIRKTLERVDKSLANTHIEAYTMVDVHDFFPQNSDGVCIGFLPTYVGGYEKLYKRIDEIFSWDTPAYEVLTTERREETIRRMTQGDFILYDDNKRDDLPCVAKVDQFGRKAVYIYSNLNFETGLFRRKLSETVPRLRVLGTDEQIPADAELTVIKSDNAAVNHYRNIYLKKGIECASGDICYMVFAAGRLFGFLIYKTYSKSGEKGCIYLLSDFVVRSQHRRLAKLLLMVSLSKEVKTLLEEHRIERLSSVLTTAFTKKPVSMKYRGIYKLKKRGEGFLNYGAKFQDVTLKEVLKTWITKHDKR